MRRTEISDRGLVRLLTATYHQPPVLRGLVDSDDKLEILAEIEGMTSARLLAERGQNFYLDPLELAWKRRKNDLRIYGETHVNAAFTYTRKSGNRFNSEERGAWYCSWDALVSISEVAYHKTRELAFAGWFHEKARYVELLADFIGVFDDLTDQPDHPSLNPDPAAGYPTGQLLADQLRRDGSIGLIYPSVRAESGNCLVCFQPGAVRNVRPGAAWELIWEGGAEYSVRSANS